MSAFLVTRSIKVALRARFPAPEWACFFEVPCGTGGRAGRSADAVAMNMYPSRGLRLHGVEVKASRSDWLREMKDPAKAEEIARFCDHWWIAAAQDIVRPDELPPTWGLLELHGKVMRQRIAAPQLKPVDMTRPFIASLMRAAAGRAARELHEQVEEATKAAREDQADRVEREIERRVNERTARHASMLTTVAEFEDASGLNLSEGLWGGGKRLGEAVKMVRDLGLLSAYSGIQALARDARKFAERADAGLAALRIVPGEDSDA